MIVSHTDKPYDGTPTVYTPTEEMRAYERSAWRIPGFVFPLCILICVGIGAYIAIHDHEWPVRLLAGVSAGGMLLTALIPKRTHATTTRLYYARLPFGRIVRLYGDEETDALRANEQPLDRDW